LNTLPEIMVNLLESDTRCLSVVVDCIVIVLGIFSPSIIIVAIGANVVIVTIIVILDNATLPRRHHLNSLLILIVYHCDWRVGGEV